MSTGQYLHLKPRVTSLTLWRAFTHLAHLKGTTKREMFVRAGHPSFVDRGAKRRPDMGGAVCWPQSRVIANCLEALGATWADWALCVDKALGEGR